MAASSAIVVSRSIQHLLRRHAALYSVAGKSLIGRPPLPLNPTPEDPISAVAATNAGFPNPSLDLALFGRFDWPTIAACEQVHLLAKKSDDEEYSDDDDSDFDSGEDFDSDEIPSDCDEEDVDEEDVPETKSSRNKRS